LGRPTLVCDILLETVARLALSAKTRRRLARKFNCKASMVPEVLLCYAAIYVAVGLIILLCLWGLILAFGG